jgi:hypothetical protein
MHHETYIELSRAEVADRARQLWKAEGRPNGRSLEYWLRAEVELLKASSTHLRNNRARGNDLPRGIAHAPVPRRLEFGLATPRARRNGCKRNGAPVPVGTGNNKPELGQLAILS